MATVAGEGLPMSHKINLPPDGTGGYPMQGQLGLGLVDYGAASIDDLVVKGSIYT